MFLESKLYHYETNCISASYEEVSDYDDSSKIIDFENFLEAVGSQEVDNLNALFSVDIDKDWAVHFSKGLFRGKPAVVIHHSRIHYFFTRNPRLLCHS